MALHIHIQLDFDGCGDLPSLGPWRMIDQYAHAMAIKGKKSFDEIRTNLILHHASSLAAKKHQFDTFIQQITAHGESRTISCGSARVSPGFDYIMAKSKVPPRTPFILASTTLEKYAEEHHCTYDMRRIGGMRLDNDVIIPDYIEDNVGLHQIKINMHLLHKPLIHAKLKLAIVQKKLFEIALDYPNEPIEYYFIDDDAMALIFSVLKKHLYIPGNIRVNFVHYSHHDLPAQATPQIFYQRSGAQFDVYLSSLTYSLKYDAIDRQLIFTCPTKLSALLTSHFQDSIKVRPKTIDITLADDDEARIRELLHIILRIPTNVQIALIDYFVNRARDPRLQFGLINCFSRHRTKSDKLGAAFYELLRQHHQVLPTAPPNYPFAINQGRLNNVVNRISRTYKNN